ncbi:MAG: Lrp/AsnC family transcriptional regulator [Desulfobacterales bacterium]|nr:Lrp/AsnC family transcriptional regulator [Desulfobacterales bacterium]
MLDDLERRIIRHLQGDLPLTSKPFAVLASRVGISEEELLERIKLQKEEGVLRRLGANLNPQLAGFRANALIAWNVPDDRMDEIGPLMASFREVSHCYERRTQGKWKYNLFTMIHGKSREDCQGIVRGIAENTGIQDYVSLVTLKEYKKTSPEYF